MRPYQEGDRFNYPELKPDSLVMDVGSYEGNWANILFQKYGCEIHCFEPVTEFYANIAKRFAGHPKIRVHNFGVGGRNRREKWGWKGSMTGVVSPGQPVEVVIEDVVDVLRADPIFGRDVALMKVNIEGGEYDLLEYLIGRQQQTANIQIQWHSVIDNCVARRKAISDALSLTHELTWQDPNFDNGHENWALVTRDGV